MSRLVAAIAPVVAIVVAMTAPAAQAQRLSPYASAGEQQAAMSGIL